MSRYFHRLAQRTGLVPSAMPRPVASPVVPHADIQEQNVATFVDQPAAARPDFPVVSRPPELAPSLPEQNTTVHTAIVRQADEEPGPAPVKLGAKNLAPAPHFDRTRDAVRQHEDTTPDPWELHPSFEPLSLSFPESSSPAMLSPGSNDGGHAPDVKRASHLAYSDVNPKGRKREKNVEAPAPRDLDSRTVSRAQGPTEVFESTGSPPPVKAVPVNAETLATTPAAGSLLRGYGSAPELARASAFVDPAPRPGLKAPPRVEVKIGAISLEIHQAPPPAAPPLTSHVQRHSAGTAFKPRRYYLRSW